MMLQNDYRSNAEKFESLSKLEWLECNGIGGYSSSSFCGMNTRKSHGLFVAPNSNITSSAPPYVILSKFEEQIIFDDEVKYLSTNQYPNSIFPHGYEFIQTVRMDLIPEFIFRVNDIKIKKSIAFIYAKNALVIIYEVSEADKPFQLQLRPLIANRECTQLQYANDSISQSYSFEGNLFHYKAYPTNPDLFIKFPNSNFNFKPDWYYNHEYLRDLESGKNFKEDLFSPGYFSISLQRGQIIGITISSESELGDPIQLFEEEKKRRERFVSKKGTKVFQKLQISAEQFFIHKKDKENLALINRYFDFNGSGEQVNIQGIPGLILATGKFSYFQLMLKKYINPNNSDPSLPSYFGDLSLQLSTALKYLQYTENLSVLEKLILPLISTFREHMISIQVEKNPSFKIKEENFPRINALFNSLKLSSFFFKLFNKEEDVFYLNKIAEKLKNDFNSTNFIGLKKESSLMKQLLSMSLPYPIHSKITGINLLENIEPFFVNVDGRNISHKTLFGEIRTLELTNFIEGLIKFKGNEGFIKGKLIFQNIMNQLIRSGKRTISETIDFSNPFGKSNDIIMDSSSTGEILRIGIEYGLFSNYFPDIPVIKNGWFTNKFNPSKPITDPENQQNPFSFISAFRDHSSSQRLYRLLSVFGIA